MRRSGVRIPLAPPQADIRSGCRFFVCLDVVAVVRCCGAAGVPGAACALLGRAAQCAHGRRPAREPSAQRASLGASSRSPARPRHRPRAPQPGPPVPPRPPRRWPVGVLRHAKPSYGVSSACRTLAWRNSPRMLTASPRLEGVWPPNRSNVACNFPINLSHIEIASLQFQRFRASQKTRLGNCMRLLGQETTPAQLIHRLTAE